MKRNQSAKRFDIVSIKLVKEGSVRYKERIIYRPDDDNAFVKQVLAGLHQAYYLVRVI